MRFCGACGSPLAGRSPAPEPVRRAAERRHMTVMFCDVVDSTSIAELMDPEDFREVLSDYQSVCASSIERYNGFTAQWVGDGVLAYFGYPRAHEDDPLRAVHAGLGILDGVRSLNEQLGHRWGLSLQVRIGIHSGTVVAGEMGAGAMREPLAIVGETPHVASRLQSLAPPGSIVVSDVTCGLLNGGFGTEALGAKSLKGISRQIPVHRVLGVLAASPELAQATGVGTPMIDRDRDRVRLAEAWEQAKQGRGVVVHIAGEAGIGKTRLVRSLRQDLAEPRVDRVLQCSAHHSGTVLYPVARFFEQRMQLESIDTPDERRSALAHAVTNVGLGPDEVVPLLADLIQIPDDARGPQPLLARDARNTMLQAIAAMLLGSSDQHPLLLVVEDLHWADPTTIELLERIVSRTPELPVACVVTHRPDFEPPWAQWQSVVEIDLGPLEQEYVREMAKAASLTELDGESLRRVQAVADGVPLFVEEMVKVLDVAPETPARAGSHGGFVPPTLQGLLTERLDRLPELTETIDQAAVLGREFDRRLLAALVEMDGEDYRTAIAKLISQDVLRVVEGYGSRLEFGHGLLHEAAYERMLRQRRRDLHARVAEILLTQSPLSSEAAPQLIAFHWTAAGMPAKALPHWKVAASRAIGRAAFLEAVEHLRQALRTLDEVHPAPQGDEERAALLTDLGRALQAGRTPAADVDDIYLSARAACERTGRRDQLVAVLEGQCRHHLIRAEYRVALERAKELLELGEDPTGPECIADGHMSAGLVAMYTGDLQQARIHLKAASDRVPTRSNPGLGTEDLGFVTGANSLAYLAVVLWNQGHVREALERSDQSLVTAEETGSALTRAAAWGMRTGLLMSQGRVAEFGEWLQRCRIHAVERNIGYWSLVSSLWTAWAEARGGRSSAGIARLREQIDEYISTGGRLGLPHFLTLMADVWVSAGDGDAAVEALRSGAEQIDATGERYYEPELYWSMARALMRCRRPDPDAARAAYERAAGAAQKQDARLLELRALNGLVLHERKFGQGCSALARVQQLCDWFDDDLSVPDLVRARELLAQGPAAEPI
jgi:class 3 adenylate cyclase/tetratricopeptide (TPR) repeat protein